MHFASTYRWLVATQQWGLPLEFDGPVLDIGGDDGEFLDRIIAPYKVGLDLSSSPQRPFDWVRADGRFLPFSDGAFSTIFAFDVIEHIEDDRAVLKEAARLLRPGGMLWLSVPACDFYLFPGGFVQSRFEGSIGHVRRGYSSEMLEARLPEDLDVEVWHWNEPAFRTFYVSLYALKRINPGWASRLVQHLPGMDARWKEGQAGHLFARITKARRV